MPQASHQQVTVFVGISRSTEETNQIGRYFTRSGSCSSFFECRTYSDIMPTSKIIILKSKVVKPHIFKIVLIVAITTQNAEFVITYGFIPLYSQFSQFLHPSITTYGRPTCKTITLSRNMLHRFAISTISVFTQIRHQRIDSYIFDWVISNVTMRSNHGIFHISVAFF